MKVAIVDDHQIIIDGICMLLGLEKDIQIVKTYTDATDLLHDLRNSNIQVDLVLTDLMMPNLSGFEGAKILKKEFPELKLIVLSMNCEPQTVYELVEKIGIEGYLSKKINRTELVRALQDANRGDVHLSEEAMRALEQFRRKIIDYPAIELSAREKQVVRLMIEGLMNREIADRLCISESTVETHRKNIYRKTETNSVPRLIQAVSDLDLLRE